MKQPEIQNKSWLWNPYNQRFMYPTEAKKQAAEKSPSDWLIAPKKKPLHSQQ